MATVKQVNETLAKMVQAGMVLAIESTDDIRYYPPNCNPALHNFALRTKELGVARVRNAQAKGKNELVQ